MAEITKKLRYRRAGVNYTIDLYDSTGDVGNDYISLRVDGQTVYARVGDISDEDASHLRVRKSGSTYAVLKVARQELPSGFIAIFDSVCPQGWTRETSFDGYFFRGASAYNPTPQGNPGHSHTFNPGTVYTSNSTEKYDKIDTNNECPLASVDHNHPFTVPTVTSSSGSPLPPYINIVFCRKN
ncbi:MAG: hypothetical protein GTO45_16505 [Candidatus Aminicenantes bacterium]|nr:hypothetical protein [Candidatus Aminicenantes bacterium]NIM78303.1 hypothetical protein [Candidatus Aminicenantes bacterium]NIN19729.1 hypothetical protein [Candidatus Aminicenantes bacterium]NIN43611.1 hypothetical protein [Candidatus Aminicenantes bacterium]NIN86356.1 hypothetical protein [Candidatus Aminicenantes bacterium]